MARAGTSTRGGGSRHLGEHVQVLDAGQAVGADRHANAGRVEALDRRIAGAGPLVAARAGHERRAAPCQLRQFAVGQLHAVHGQQPLGQQAEFLEVSTGPQRGGVHARVPAPSASSAAPDRSAAMIQEVTPRGLSEMNARERIDRVIGNCRNNAGDTEYGAWGVTLRDESIPRSRASTRARASRTNASGSAALKPRTSWKTCAGIPASSAAQGRQRVADVADSPVPAVRASAMAVSPRRGCQLRTDRRTRAQRSTTHPRIERRRPAARGPRMYETLEVRVRIHERRDDRCAARRTAALQRGRRTEGRAPPQPTMRPASTATQPSRIGGAAMGSTHAAR